MSEVMDWFSRGRRILREKGKVSAALVLGSIVMSTTFVHAGFVVEDFTKAWFVFEILYTVFVLLSSDDTSAKAPLGTSHLLTLLLSNRLLPLFSC